MSSCFEKCYLPCGCKAYLDGDDDRADLWRKALGSLVFPLKHPISHEAVDEKGKLCNFLQGDWFALSAVQQSRMKDELKAKFGIDKDGFFYQQIQTLGYMPIKDEHITVTCCQLHSRMMM